jgi:hypothetical protein
MDTGPLPALGYPPAGGRRYMANEQLPWLTLSSQQDAPGFAWRFQRRKARKGYFSYFFSVTCRR